MTQSYKLCNQVAKKCYYHFIAILRFYSFIQRLSDLKIQSKKVQSIMEHLDVKHAQQKKILYLEEHDKGLTGNTPESSPDPTWAQ